MDAHGLKLKSGLDEDGDHDILEAMEEAAMDMDTPVKKDGKGGTKADKQQTKKSKKRGKPEEEEVEEVEEEINKSKVS